MTTHATPLEAPDKPRKRERQKWWWFPYAIVAPAVLL